MRINYPSFLILIVINVVVFMFQTSIPNLTALIALNTDPNFFTPFMFITHMFAHSSFNHLFFNMFALFIFGNLLEGRIGTKRFLTIYFASGLLAGLIGYFIYDFALGASAAIMGIIGASIIFFPNVVFLFFFVIPMKLWMLGILYVLIDVFGLFYANSTANLAHLIGMFFGLGYGYYLYDMRKKYLDKFMKNKREHDLKKQKEIPDDVNKEIYVTYDEMDEYNKKML